MKVIAVYIENTEEYKKIAKKATWIYYSGKSPKKFIPPTPCFLTYGLKITGASFSSCCDASIDFKGEKVKLVSVSEFNDAVNKRMKKLARDDA